MSSIGHMTGQTRRLPIADVRPYEENPRVISAEAVEAVRESIARYGYNQPIVVDREMVVIVGHTRLQALAALGYTHVDVYVAANLSPEKAREYRLADNRTAELGQWDPSALITELREWEADLLATYFPNVDLEVGQLQAAQTDELERELEAASTAVASVRPNRPVLTTTVTCPGCAGHFMVETSSLPGLSHADVETLRAEQLQRDGRDL